MKNSIGPGLASTAGNVFDVAEAFRQANEPLQTNRSRKAIGKNAILARVGIVFAISIVTASNAAAQLGSTSGDQVYTPVQPCRIVDTRNAGGPIAANSLRLFYVDESSFVEQGGFDGSCGIPQGVATAVAMTLTVTQPDNAGYFTAWAFPLPQPLASFLNFTPGQTIANTTIVPVFQQPLGLVTLGEFALFVGNADAHAVIDVVGYFAPPVATALDCTTVSSTAATTFGLSSTIMAYCPAGRTATGGGFLGPLGMPASTYPVSGNGWGTNFSSSFANGVTTYVTCCRIPGR